MWPGWLSATELRWLCGRNTSVAASSWWPQTYSLRSGDGERGYRGSKAKTGSDSMLMETKTVGMLALIEPENESGTNAPVKSNVLLRRQHHNRSKTFMELGYTEANGR